MGSAIARVTWEIEIAPVWRRTRPSTSSRPLGPCSTCCCRPAVRPARARAIVRAPGARARHRRPRDDQPRRCAAPFARLAIDTLARHRGAARDDGRGTRPEAAGLQRGSIAGPAPRPGSAGELPHVAGTARAADEARHRGRARRLHVVPARGGAGAVHARGSCVAMGAQEWERAVAFEALEQARNASLPPMPLPAMRRGADRARGKDEAAIRRFLEAKQLLTVPRGPRHYLNLLLPPYLAPLSVPRRHRRPHQRHAARRGRLSATSACRGPTCRTSTCPRRATRGRSSCTRACPATTSRWRWRGRTRTRSAAATTTRAPTRASGSTPRR